MSQFHDSLGLGEMILDYLNNLTTSPLLPALAGKMTFVFRSYAVRYALCDNCQDIVYGKSCHDIVESQLCK